MTTTNLIASRVFNENLHETLLSAIRAILDEPEMVSKIVSSILASPPACKSAPMTVAGAMASLEAIAEVDAEIACCLMAHLWVHASQTTGEFEVCDAIDLWISKITSPYVVKQLRFLHEMAPDHRSQQHFLSMLTP
jgi:hypothetical protein